MKNVVFDPICNFGGGKATEWIPLLPGSDGAIALAMINILLNELNIFDAEFLKKKTNGAYLIDLMDSMSEIKAPESRWSMILLQGKPGL